MLGLRQSGLLDFRSARLPGDEELLILAREEAFAIIDTDPGLLAPEHAGLRTELPAPAEAAKKEKP